MGKMKGTPVLDPAGMTIREYPVDKKNQGIIDRGLSPAGAGNLPPGTVGECGFLAGPGDLHSPYPFSPTETPGQVPDLTCLRGNNSRK